MILSHPSRNRPAAGPAGPAAPARRAFVVHGTRLLLGAGCAILVAHPATAAARLDFDELYAKVTVLGLTFSDKVKSLDGQIVTMRGFMAPPLKAEANFFVLTEIPMSICPFCSSDSDWPDNIVVIYLDRAQTFAQANAPIDATGRLEVGSWTDPATGFVSLLRLVGASFSKV
ncbi:RNA polymerase subunit RPABC4/transcription elongation factor Spt4 [Ancylobacter vacuolatus]|uniref:RNA polymerase subunit RPABC4/transcription elongation factor Spt4 n=1 Tax=Ancylobacter vacuolatus TaxID=223389 RepID=A0ABU0DKC2_9HYPH|nr:RNA polymerase subunit RPABC4/transcription elongation factor Spt4 [Ancylobacter vacuolatus]